MGKSNWKTIKALGAGLLGAGAVLMALAAGRTWADTASPLGARQFIQYTNTATNVVVVSGSPNGVFDGAYSNKFIAGAYPVYTNASYGLYSFDSSWVGVGADGAVLTNGSGAILFICGNRLPVGSAGNWYTNVNNVDTVALVTNMTSSYLVITNKRSLYSTVLDNLQGPKINNDLYVDATNGSDIFWMRGHPELALRTFQAAASVFTNAGDILHLAAGNYASPSSPVFTLPDGAQILGSGRGVTIISTPGGGIGITIKGTNGLIRDLTYNGVLQSDNSASDVLNGFVIENCDVIGANDGVYLQAWQSFKAVNCTFGSGYDAFVDFQNSIAGRTTVTNAVANLYNCTLAAVWKAGSANDGECTIPGSNTFNFYNCSLICSFSNTTHAAIIGTRADLGTHGGGTVNLFNCALAYWNTNGAAALFVANTNGAETVNCYGMIINTNDIVGPSNKVTVVRGLRTNQ